MGMKCYKNVKKGAAKELLVVFSSFNQGKLALHIARDGIFFSLKGR